MAEHVEIVEDIEEVTEDPSGATEVLDDMAEVVLAPESAPEEERTFVSWFLTLQERNDPGTVLRYRDTMPEALSTKVAGALKELFCTNRVHLYLPWWDEKNLSKVPTDWYELKYASNSTGAKQYAHPYDPLVVKREKAGAVVAVMYQGHLLRKEKELPMLMELLEELVADPKGFFDRMGKRWGRCLCCKREITADKSLQHAIGPVCYKRLRTLDGWVAKVTKDVGVLEGVSDLVSTAHTLNPVERQGVAKATVLFRSYIAAGFTLDEQLGLLLMPKDTVVQRPTTPKTCGDLVEVYVKREERYKYSVTVGRARKESVLVQVVKGTPQTVGVLVQLGAVWHDGAKAWLLCKEVAKDLPLHFRVTKATPADAQGGQGGESSVLAPPPLSGVKKSTPKDRTITVTALAGNIVEVTGDTYMHRKDIKEAGATWDKTTRSWRAHLDQKPLLDAIAARVNGQ